MMGKNGLKKTFRITIFVGGVFFFAGCNAASEQSGSPTKIIEETPISSLSDLKNFQVNTPKMVSAGMPTPRHFEALKTMGVRTVIDLIPGDRSDEIELMDALEMPYHNISVDWDNPRLENFEQYVTLMNQSLSKEGITLTHCKLNWRGAVFTYLYRTTQLNEPEELAKKDLDAIWRANEVWQAFIDQIKAKYKQT